MPNELIELAHASRLLRDPSDVEAFERALGRYAARMRPEDLPDLLGLFDDDTEHHEVMFGLVHLVDEFPAAVWIRAYLDALPRLGSRAPEWAETLMARSVNSAETSGLLVDTLRTSGPDTQRAAAGLLAGLAQVQPKPVGVRAEAVLRALTDGATWSTWFELRDHERVVGAARANGARVFEFDGGDDVGALFRAFEARLPLDPPISGRVHWDAFADSLWSGLDRLAVGPIAIVWRGAERLRGSDPGAFAVASDVLTSTAARISLALDGAVGGHEVRVFLERGE